MVAAGLWRLYFHWTFKSKIYIFLGCIFVTFRDGMVQNFFESLPTDDVKLLTFLSLAFI